MKIMKKICRMLMHSPYTLPVCALVSVVSVVYSFYTVGDMVAPMTIVERINLPGDFEISQDDYISEHPDDQEILENPGQESASVFSTHVNPQQPGDQAPEQAPEEYPTEQDSTPPSTQKPAQTTKPQTQAPQTSVTTKPQQNTQKPADTTAQPTQKPVTGWSVTYKQAKSMVKADSAYDYEDLYWLSRIISAEAKGESFTGQIGVGSVVLNRVRSSQFPNTVKGVVFDKKYGTQFTPVANGSIYDTPTQSAVVAAKMCLDGYTLSDSVLYFLNPSIATSSWIQNNRKYAFRVGNHEFYH